MLQQLAQEEPRLRVIHLAANQEKRWRSAGAAAARGDLLVCIDGDACWTGIPRLAGRAVDPLSARRGGHRQSADPHPIHADRPHSGWEFSSIIGLIKRTQRIYGRVFTVSGVIAAFRRRALADVGYWADMITEDIDISWKLQLRHWDIFFEPRALC